MSGDGDKIIRIPGKNLLIEFTNEEEKYRNKYLPDPKKLTDTQLSCTVCSEPLTSNVHKGKDLFVHKFLEVLVCELCYNFYGDGCFSADEDGDDKYCRWCGQGGILCLCSKCSCTFCKKCVQQNMKPAVLAKLEKDDWQCYFCNPRPLFGFRAICWGAQELNEIGKAKEQERLRKQEQRSKERKKGDNLRWSRKGSTRKATKRARLEKGSEEKSQGKNEIDNSSTEQQEKCEFPANEIPDKVDKEQDSQHPDNAKNSSDGNEMNETNKNDSGNGTNLNEELPMDENLQSNGGGLEDSQRESEETKSDEDTKEKNGQ